MNWIVTCGGVSAPAATWGILNLQRTRKPFAADEVTFTLSGQAIDAPSTFAQWSLLSITDPNGRGWFTGLVTKIPVKGSTKAEDQFYTVEGPWRNFEKLVFQEEWMAMGETEVLVPTLRTTTIIGQTATVTDIPLDQMIVLVANYVLALAGTSRYIPFQFALDPSLATIIPAYTDAEGYAIPAGPMMVPFTEVKDLTCSQLIINMLVMLPDMQQWVDYTTNPPTLNMFRRGSLTPMSIAAFGGIVDGIDLTPRADLVVPAVILKYIQNNTITTGKSSTTYNTITPDIYPPNAPDPAIDNFVADVELEPGNMTFMQQDIVTLDRPLDYDAIAGTGTPPQPSAWDWLTDPSRLHWLTKYTIPANWPGGSNPPYPANPTNQDVDVYVNGPWLDSGSGLSTLNLNSDQPSDWIIRRIATRLTPSFKTAVLPPTNPPSTTDILELPSGNVPAGGGPGTAGGGHYTIDGVALPVGDNALDLLCEELRRGSVTSWMTEDQSIYAAHVTVTVVIQYTGNDPVVLQWFTSAPVQLLTRNYDLIVTNGETGTYTQLSSEKPSEPIPVGLAKIIYDGLSVLHYDGTISTTEPECSGLVSPGNVLNLTGGANAGWAAMNAQINEVTENVDAGKTTIRVGPPKHLSASQLVDWIRAIRGKIQSWHLTQQQTGQVAGSTIAAGQPGAGQPGGDNVIQGPGHTPRSSESSAPTSSSQPRNLFVVNASTGSTPGVTVTPGSIGGIVPTINGTAINASTPPVLQLNSGDTLLWFELSYNSSNVLTSVLINHGTTMPTPNIVPGTAGTDYYPLSTVTVTTGVHASVQALNDYISGNQGYAQCGTGSNCWLK